MDSPLAMAKEVAAADLVVETGKEASHSVGRFGIASRSRY